MSIVGDGGGAQAVALAVSCERNEARAYRSLFETAALPGFGVDDASGAVRLVAPAVRASVLCNRVIGWGTQCVADEASLDHLMSTYLQRSQGFAIEVASPALGEAGHALLRARRLRRVTSSQVLVLHLDADGPAFASGPEPPGLSIRLAGPEHRPALARLCIENFGVSPEIGRLLERGTVAPEWRCWMAFDADVPVGASLSRVDGDAMWSGWTSVTPSHRGRRLYEAFINRQLDDARAAGCRFVSTDTARSTPAHPDPAYRKLRAIGYSDAYLRQTWVWAPPRA